MQQLRVDARRPCAARRDRVSPVRVALPAAAAIVVLGATVTGSVLAGLPVSADVLVTLVVALAGGCVAHRAVRSVVAGVILRLVRPYGPGERLRLPGPAGVVEAELIRVGFANSTLCTEDGLLTVPNIRLFTAR